MSNEFLPDLQSVGKRAKTWIIQERLGSGAARIHVVDHIVDFCREKQIVSRGGPSSAAQRLQRRYRQAIRRGVSVPWECDKYRIIGESDDKNYHRID